MAEIDILTKALDIGIAVALIIGGLKEWYVWGPTYRR